jgi:tRNA pseudouridine55 synthase
VTPSFGFINAFKPPGPSSASFGNWVKNFAGGSAVGHWGTLDPLACGVLALGIGKAARLFPLLESSRKSYIFELIVGEQTDSGDSSGVVVAQARVPDDWQAHLPSAAAKLVGPQLQIPPMHSAVKVAGKPLYRSARAGRDVPRAARSIAIYSLRVLPRPTEANHARLFVECDAGTYVRVLCESLGRELRLPARMGALLRVASGPFRLDASVTPALIQSDFEQCLINPLDVLRNPRIELDKKMTRRFLFGNEVLVECSSASLLAECGSASLLALEGTATSALVTHHGKLLGVAQVFTRDAKTILAPTRVFAPS